MKKVSLITFAVAIIIIYLIVSNRNIDEYLQDKFTQFNKTNLNGRLVYIAIKEHRIAFKLHNENSEYLFNPNSLNDSGSFEDIATSEDSIVKPSFSDTLFLYHKLKTYKYLFEKKINSAFV